MDLSSLNMENIESILSSMSDEDMEMLKSAAEGLFASMGQNEEKKERHEKNEKKTGGANIFDGFNIDFETVTRIMSLMEKLKHQPQDPRCNLLLSLKPMLSEKRRGKVDEAVKIMSLMSFLPIIEELRGN